jgi:hypothetical protein
MYFNTLPPIPPRDGEGNLIEKKNSQNIQSPLVPVRKYGDKPSDQPSGRIRDSCTMEQVSSPLNIYSVTMALRDAMKAAIIIGALNQKDGPADSIFFLFGHHSHQ